MDKLTVDFEHFFNHLIQNGAKINDVEKLCMDHLRDNETKRNFKKSIEQENHDKCGYITRSQVCCWFVIPSVIAFTASMLCYCSVFGYEDMSNAVQAMITEPPCLLDHNEFTADLTRPLFDCSICHGLTTVPIERNLSKEQFEKLYAYTALPVLVKDSSINWSAKKLFTFDFLKRLYEEHEGALDMVEEQCQFFPYNTDFKSLADVFNMSVEMSQLQLQKWYVGWSNCVPVIEKELRRYYQKPSFLPSDSESTSLDWIFMGGWGYGAPIHVDYVQRPSWQAQLSGKKTWMLIPVPECESVCHNLQVTLYTGDILVVDTNQWYHSTYIHPGEISITIGSEYD